MIQKIDVLRTVPDIACGDLREVAQIGGKFSLANLKIPTGRQTQLHLHRTFTEFYRIIAGEGDMNLDGQITPVCAGDIIRIEPCIWHQIVCKGLYPLEIDVFCSPSFDPNDIIIPTDEEIKELSSNRA